MYCNRRTKEVRRSMAVSQTGTLKTACTCMHQKKKKKKKKKRSNKLHFHQQTSTNHRADKNTTRMIFTWNLLPNAWRIFLQDALEEYAECAFVFCLLHRMMLWLEQELCHLQLFGPPEKQVLCLPLKPLFHFHEVGKSIHWIILQTSNFKVFSETTK